MRRKIQRNTTLPAGEPRSLIDKAQTIAPGIFDIERKFTAWPLHYLARFLIVKPLFRETVQALRPFVNLLEVAYREVNVIGNRFRLFAPRRHVNQCQNYGATIEIVPRASRYSCATVVK